MKPFGKSMLVVVCLMSAAIALDAAWTTKRITNNAGDSNAANVAVNSSNIYVVWSDDTFGENYDIYLRKSTDSGATWQTQKRLTNNTGASYSPSIAVNGSNVFLVWSDNSPGNYEIYFRKSTNSGATWQAAKRLTNNTGASSSPRIAVDGSNVYVVWDDSTPENREIYFRKSTDAGATWQTEKRLTNNTGSSFYPRIAVIISNVYVVWQDDTPGNCDIYFRKSTDGGETWQTARKLTSNTGISAGAAIAVSGSNVYVVWWEQVTIENEEIYFRKSMDGGATWPTLKRLTNNVGESMWPEIAAGGSNVYAVWWDNTFGGNDDVYLRKSTDSGATWQTQKRLTNNAGGSWPSGIAVNDSNIYVVWVDETPGNNEIYITYSPL